MVVRKLTQEEFCLVLQRIIFRLGIERALKQDIVRGRKIEAHQFYSGPERRINDELKKEFRAAGVLYINNWHISQAQADRENAIRIDDTYIGRILDRCDLKNYFFGVYNDRRKADDAEYFVWAYASRAFTAAGDGVALTAVIAADRIRVYRREETGEMNRRRNYETLNDRPANAELDTIRGDEERFHRRTSLIELWRSLHIAMRERKPELAREYFRRKEFYLLQRRNQFSDAGKDPPIAYQLDFEERRRREAIFVLAILDFDAARPAHGRKGLSTKAAAL